jgi:hypothetical protein
MENLRHLVASHPFAKVAGTPGVRLNITFLLRPDQDGSDFEFESPKGDLWAKRISDGEVAGMVVPSPGLGTLDLMALVEKRFGSEVTTRTWSTVKKLVALGG